ncbi:MAG: hypothetical protein KatS3mg131_0275 [Candidatus Tectimicrobiota bacterium]|nr:MAG: hypothetical protein KatS3mg131_0275 [Candidatus Tectomicrobia bacterium]
MLVAEKNRLGSASSAIRPRIRAALYMGTLVATRAGAVINGLYARLVNRAGWRNGVRS